MCTGSPPFRGISWILVLLELLLRLTVECVRLMLMMLMLLEILARRSLLASLTLLMDVSRRASVTGNEVEMVNELRLDRYTPFPLSRFIDRSCSVPSASPIAHHSSVGGSPDVAASPMRMGEGSAREALLRSWKCNAVDRACLVLLRPCPCALCRCRIWHIAFQTREVFPVCPGGMTWPLWSFVLPSQRTWRCPSGSRKYMTGWRFARGASVNLGAMRGIQTILLEKRQGYMGSWYVAGCGCRVVAQGVCILAEIDQSDHVAHDETCLDCFQCLERNCCERSLPNLASLTIKHYSSRFSQMNRIGMLRMLRQDCGGLQ